MLDFLSDHQNRLPQIQLTYQSFFSFEQKAQQSLLETHEAFQQLLRELPNLSQSEVNSQLEKTKKPPVLNSFTYDYYSRFVRHILTINQSLENEKPNRIEKNSLISNPFLTGSPQDILGRMIFQNEMASAEKMIQQISYHKGILSIACSSLMNLDPSLLSKSMEIIKFISSKSLPLSVYITAKYPPMRQPECGQFLSFSLKNSKRLKILQNYVKNKFRAYKTLCLVMEKDLLNLEAPWVERNSPLMFTQEVTFPTGANTFFFNLLSLRLFQFFLWCT